MTSVYKAILIDPVNDARWDKFVEEHPFCPMGDSHFDLIEGQRIGPPLLVELWIPIWRYGCFGLDKDNLSLHVNVGIVVVIEFRSSNSVAHIDHFCSSFSIA